MRRALAILLLAVGCADTADGADASIADAWSRPPDAGPPLRVASVEDLGALPHPSDTVAGRDGASSGVIDGRLLWTFGDTFLYEPTPVDGSHVVSATGAWATPSDPLTLEQPVDENGIPAQLVPYSDDELAQNRVAPLDGWSLWPGALIDTGDDALLLLFQRIERSEGAGFDGRGVGTARIGPGETVARRDPSDLFTAPSPSSPDGEPLYGVGGVAIEGDTAYFFACESIGILNQGCRVARVPRARADDRSAFEFYDGATWVADAAAAAIVIENVGAAHSVTWNAHLGRYLSITSRPLSNDVLLRAADRIEGPWPEAGVVIGTESGGILAAGEGSNYLAQEQPALSAPDGTSVVISYSRPLGSFRGEVRLARVTLE